MSDLTTSVRKTTTTYHETGIGQSPREEVTYQLGATIDGVFVPFTTLTENHVQNLVAAGKAADEAEKTETKAK